jgi:hypothetical protein
VKKSVGLYTAAFAVDLKLASDFQTGLRYNVACAPALAAVCQGEDAAKLGNTVKAKLRGQALDWLNAETLATKKENK